MKKINESAKSTMSEYFAAIQSVVNEESSAIQSYDSILGMTQLPASVRSIIEEIRDDEKDHLVILTNLLQDIVEDELPDFGDEDSMLPIEEEE